MDDRAWLMQTINARMTVARLEELAAAIPEEFGGRGRVSFQKKVYLIDFIERCRRAYWDSRHEPETHREGKTFTVRVLPASEVNAWLATLPPVPPYPETCDCEVCHRE